MYQFAETQDSRIAHYSFGSSISQFGVTVFSCTDARENKKIFGNDPDPEKEVVLDGHSELVKQWIADHPGGKVDQCQEDIFTFGETLQVHHRTVMFGSTWRSDSLKPANKSILYRAGAHTHFRMPGIARMISHEAHGVAACSGFEDLSVMHRKAHLFEKSGAFTPHSVGSIIVPMHSCWYHKTKMQQHYPFLVSEADTIQITVDKPTLVLEFIKEEPDVAEFARTWLQQIEDGLIEIVDR